jgi:PTS system nitrogen regulatory IIA component
MNISNFLTAKNVLSGVRASGKEDLLRQLSLLAPPDPGITSELVYKALVAREALGCTATGKGIAMPHAGIKHLTKPFGFFARLEKRIPFGALDDKPVDLVFLLLTPEGSGRENISALAAVSRRLRDEDVVRRIRAAPGVSTIYKELISPTPAA